jgi:TolA-binding protein
VVKRALPLGIALVLAASACGCAYFNTFYAAKKNFEGAEIQMKQQVNDPDARANAGQAALYDKAIEGATKIVVEYSKSKWVDDAILLIGRSQLAKGDYTGAQEKFDELNTNFPTSELRDQATYWSAVAADRDHRPADALTLYDSVLTGYPKFKQKDDARLRRANVYLTIKQPEQALPDLRELSTRKGAMGYDAGQKLAEALFAQRDYASARAEFERVAEQAPTESQRLDARLRSGDCDEAAGEYAQAADSYLRLLRDSHTDDGRARARLRYGSALALSGDVDRGLTELKNVVDDYPRTPYAAEALFRTGYLQEVVRDDFDAAGKAYDQVSEQAPGSPFAVQARERRQNLARLAEAMSASRDTTAEGRAAEAALRQAEHYLFQLGKPDRALEQYVKVEHDYPKSQVAPRAAYGRGWVLGRRLGRPEDARLAFESLISHYPDSDEAKAAAHVLANPADTTYAREQVAGTAMPFPMVPGNPLYVPPPPITAPRSKGSTAPKTTPATGVQPTGMTQARADSLRAASRHTAPAAPDTSAGHVKID